MINGLKHGILKKQDIIKTTKNPDQKIWIHFKKKQQQN